MRSSPGFRHTPEGVFDSKYIQPEMDPSPNEREILLNPELHATYIAPSRMRPDPATFKDKYHQEEIDADVAYVNEKESEPHFQKGQHFSTELSEGFVYWAATHKIFGESIRGVTVSRYDDIRNKTDIVLEIFDGTSPEPARLALDITGGSDKAVDSKKDDIKRMIERERLGVVKYYASDTKRGQVEMPKAYFSMPHTMSNEIATSLLHNSLNAEKFKREFLTEVIKQLRLICDMITLKAIPGEHKAYMLRRYKRVIDALGAELDKKPSKEEMRGDKNLELASR